MTSAVNPVSQSLGSLTLSVEPSLDPISQKTNAVGQMVLQSHHHESTVYWRGRRYKFILDLPIATHGQNLEELNGAIEGCRNAFLKSLEEQISEEIQPGKEFSILFNESGYTAFTPDTQKPFDPETTTLDEGIREGLIKNPVRVENEVAKKISKLIRLGNAGQILEGLKEFQKDKPIPLNHVSPVPSPRHRTPDSDELEHKYDNE